MRDSARTAFFRRLTELQAKRPLLVLMIALLTVLPSLLLAHRLELRTGFDELLPEDMPSVLELRRSGQRLPSNSTLTVAAESKDTALLKRFVDEMGPKLRELPKDLVGHVDVGPRETELFVEKHKHLYVELEQLEALRDDIVARYDWQAGEAMGTNLDGEAPPPVDAKSIEERFAKKRAEAQEMSLGQDGYYLGEDGHFIAILVRTPLVQMDQRAFELQGRIAKLIDEGGYSKVAPDFRYGFTGSLLASAEEYRSVYADLIEVGALGFALVLLVVYLFFLRLRVLVALGVSILLGCLWTFAVVELVIGYLNTASGFLISVVAGNGINAMMIYMARYLEARRDQRQGLNEALATASVDTSISTFSAVAVATVAYGALMTTDFLGFRHFGVIGAIGMLLCWVSTYTVLPAVLVLCERVRPFAERRDWRDRLSGLYGKPFIWLAKRYAGPIAVLGVMSAVVGVVCTGLYFSRDSMEYDMKQIQNVNGADTDLQKLSRRVDKVAGRINQIGRAVLLDRIDQVAPLVAELERRRDEAPKDQKPFDRVVSIFNLLPADQEQKLEILKEIRERVDRAHRRKLLSDEDYRAAEQHLPKQLSAIGMADLPELVARPFTEKDGTRGRIVIVAPTPGRSLDDAHYLIQWADSFREVQLDDGTVVYGTGDAVVFADMLTSIANSAPRVALLSFLGTVVVILIAFRGRSGGWVALGVLALGLSWLMTVLYVLDVKLNFLNFVALPIAIGVGSDYAINVMQRREIEGDAGIERAFLETGGAVVACSMTTLSGYAALLSSVNGAVRSLGLTAGVGEAATQLSAMLVLPAVLYWIAARRAKKAGAAAQIESKPTASGGA